MSYLVATPEAVLDAARDLTSLRSTINAARAAAAPYTTNLLAAAADEVSAAIAALFSDHGSAYQALSAQTDAFHIRFLQTLDAGAAAYAGAESASAAALKAVSPASPMQTGLSAAAADVAIVMGPSGFPVPAPLYVMAAMEQYIQPFFPGALPLSLTTPEGLFPITGINTLPLDSSVKIGVTTLNNAVMQQIAAGNHVDVFGYSQSSLISSIAMSQLAANHVSPSDVSFVLLGDPANPNGGFITRLNIPYPLGGTASFPTFGITLSGATPSDLYPTQIFTKEYDGFADFPRYPINLLSVLNAYAGIGYDHGTYLNPTPGSETLNLGTYGQTTYYMITEPGLPLLNPLKVVPVVGQPLYDLLEPDTRILVNLGYGNIDHGWDTQSPPNVPTPLGLFPTDINPNELITALNNGAQHGITTAIADLQHPSFNLDWSSIQNLLGTAHTFGLTPTLITNPIDPPSNLIELLTAASTYGNGNVPVTANNVFDAFGGVVSNYAALTQPVVDTALTLGIDLPVYDANLFVDGLQNGDLLAAIVKPVAANMALVPFIIGAGVALPLGEATAITVSEFVSLLP
ncbi:MAG: PE-PPE domain-containing protein [Mycobacterium sp.]